MNSDYLKERFDIDVNTCEVHEGEAAQKYLKTRQTDEVSLNAFTVKDCDQGKSVYKNGIGNTPTQFANRFSQDDYRKFAEGVGIKWREEYADRVLPHVASDERVDAHGDIVLQHWDFSAFKDNPAMPFNHDWAGLPVGTHIHWEVGQQLNDRYNGPALMMLSLYATEDEYPLADSIYRLAKARFLRANSVGFYPKTAIVPAKEDRERLGMPDYGAIFDDNLLLEDSPTLLGANEGALQILRRGRDRGIIQPVDLVAIRELARRNCTENDQWKNVDSEYREMAQAIFPEAKFFSHSDVEEPFDLQAEHIASTKNEMALLGAKLDAQSAYLQSALSGIAASVEDIRDMLTAALIQPEDDSSPFMINGTTVSEGRDLVEIFAQKSSTLLQKLEDATRN